MLAYYLAYVSTPISLSPFQTRGGDRAVIYGGPVGRAGLARGGAFGGGRMADCGAAAPGAYTSRYGCLCLAAAGAFPCAPAMTNWVTCNTPSLLTIPFAIALHNSCAGIGQIIAQWIWKADEAEAGYPTGNFVCAACCFFVAVVAACLRLWYARMNKIGATDARGEKRIWSY